MKIRKHRPLPHFKPSHVGEVFTRFAVQRVRFLPGARPQRLASGIGLEPEARIIFRDACDEIRRDAAYGSTGIVLERHTVEVIAYQGPATRNVVEAARLSPIVPAGPVGIQPLTVDARGAQFLDYRDRLLSMIVRAFAMPGRRLEPAVGEAHKISGAAVGAVFYDEHGPPPARVDPHEVLVGMFKIGAGHQGGHSTYGRMIADALKTEFPLTMHAMAIRALEVGLNPRELWDWWDRAPADMDEAVALYVTLETPATD